MLKASNCHIFTLIGFFLFSCLPKPENKPLNFVIIQADDLGFDDLPLNGNQYVETPGLDKLAEDAVVFHNFYVNPVCAPTRASLLTGRDFLLTGVSHVHGGKDFINLNEKTFADIFNSEGYKTGMWGKWHSGKTEGYYPWQRGFDEAYMAKLYKHKNSEGFLNGKYVKHNKWADEVIVDYALNFIAKNKEEPFIAYVSFLTCHAPLEAKPAIIEKYENKGLPHNLSILYGMIDQMDQEINRLIHGIEKLGISENTAVLFMSDNGPAIINNWLSKEERAIRYHGNWKGHKGNIWNNGVKSPLLLKYPAKLKHRETNVLCDVSDVFPTIAELAGINLDKYQLDLTGRSFAQNLLNKNDSRPEKLVFNYADRGWPPSDAVWSPEGIKNEYQPVESKTHDPYLQYEDQIISVQNEHYKLLKNASSRENAINSNVGYALIDMHSDPHEDYNVVHENEQVFSQLEYELRTKFESILSEENSFSPITFQIGNDLENRVLMYAPVKVSEGVKVAYSSIIFESENNNWAEYSIDVKEDMIVIPTISSKKPLNNESFKIFLEESVSISVDIQDDKIIFEPLHLRQGVQKILFKCYSNSSLELIEIMFPVSKK